MARTLDEIENSPAPWPTSLKIAKNRETLSIAYDDGAAFDIPSELLRVESPSAEVQGHGAGQKQLVAGKRAVKLIQAEPNGNYAVRLGFDDGHATGIYTWRYLRFLGENQATLLGDYLDALDDAGLSRDG
jgi:DUF971 family protein